MKILLTRDQEATLWNHQQSLVTQKATYLFFPYFLRHLGSGEYERLTFDQLPEDAKEQLLQQKGIKIPTE